MLGGACPSRRGEKYALRVDQWMAAVRSDSRCDYCFYVAPAGIDRLFITSRSLGDDPVFCLTGSAFNLFGDRDFSIVQTISQSPNAVVVMESALPRAVFCGGHGMAGRLYFYRIFLAFGPLLRRNLPPA